MIKKGLENLSKININPNLLSEIKKLKKVELHAHLFGSIKRESLKKLLRKKGLENEITSLEKDLQNINFDTIFARLFGYVEKSVRSKSDLVSLIEMVVQDFAEDNVIYLELRSGPKKMEDLDEIGYINTVLDTLNKINLQGEIKVCYVMSINRKKPAEFYTDLFTKILKSEIQNKDLLVGIDFSGDVRKGRFEDYIQSIDLLRKGFPNLGVTVHSPEKEKFVNELKIIQDYLKKLPNNKGRIGHYVHYTLEDLESVISNNLPIEICPTSNYIVKDLNSWDEHHFKELLQHGLKTYTVSTDDMLLFDSSISREWGIACSLGNLSLSDVKKGISNSVDFLFCNDEIKSQIQKQIQLN